MEHVSTGFAELDNILEAGLTSPSCICVSGQFHPTQRNFMLQLINNFLQKGMKGLYICLDRPANEVKNQFKRLGIDIDAYDKDYSLFFVDFFSYSQNAFIETSTLQTLEYRPRLLLDTLSPFLDWIRNGFIIIDTLSTLTLNMDSKEAYEFMRGVKLLGRAFNLIAIGVTHKPIAELDPIMSNSDGNLSFGEETVTINHFENIHNETLAVVTGKNGVISIKSPLSEAVNKKIGVPILSALSDAGVLKMVPTLNVASSQETGYTTEEVAEKMNPLLTEDTVTRTPYCSTFYCPDCNSKSLELYIQCPECQSRVLVKGDILEHFKCGNIDFEEKFNRDGKLACGKCNRELKQVGVDYRKVGVGYRCTNRHLFSIPKMVFVCAQCREQFGLDAAKLQTQFSYELTEKGKRQAIQAGYHPE